MRNILIVDNYPNLDFLYSMYLEEAGHNVFIAQSTDEAIDIALSERIDVLVADQFTEGLGPEDLISILKLLNPGIRGILSAVSSFSSGRDAAVWDEAVYKGLDYFQKLKETIERVLGDGLFDHYPPVSTAGYNRISGYLEALACTVEP